MIGCAFIHDLGDAVGEWSVSDVGVSGDPTDVGGAPVNVVILHVENVFAGGVCAGEVAAASVEDALGFSGRAGGVKDEEGVFAIEGFGFVL